MNTIDNPNKYCNVLESEGAEQSTKEDIKYAIYLNLFSAFHLLRFF